MCGRYALKAPRSRLAERYFGITQPVGDVHPNYNITPGSVITIVRQGGEYSLGYADFDWAWWGYRPERLIEDPKAPSPINARAEKVAASRYFRDAFSRRRCLIPATGWYEWQQTEAGKQPYFIRHADTDKTLFFAGIYDSTGKGTGKSTAIITRPASPGLAHIHHRMPLVLDPVCFGAWLNEDLQERDVIRSAATSLSPEQLSAHPVSTRVNSPKNNDEGLIQPVA